MKNIFKLMGLVLLAGALSLASCTKEEENNPNNGNNTGDNNGGNTSTIARANIGSGTFGDWGTVEGLDFNKDGNLEYRFATGYTEEGDYIENGSLDFSANWSENGMNIVTMGTMNTGNWDKIKTLTSGTTIDGSCTYGAEGDAAIDATSGATSVYVGLRIKLGNNIHYGWAHANVATGSGDYAYVVTWDEAYYNTTPNAAIKAGQK